MIVDAQVNDATLHNTPRKLQVTEASAPVYFHLRDGMQIDRLQARALGGNSVASG